jgi:hypothetical protein
MISTLQMRGGWRCYNLVYKMSLFDPEKIQDVNDLIKKAKDKNTVDQTKILTKYYITTRFNISESEFERNYVDGENDGGLDFVRKLDDDHFYILQSKFTSTPKETSFQDIKHEIDKIFNTIIGENPNKRAADFINSLGNNLKNPNMTVQIDWLTTNTIPDRTKEEVEKHIESLTNKHNITAKFEFWPIDKEQLTKHILDYHYKFIPLTGRKTLSFEGNHIPFDNKNAGIEAVLCIIKITEILKWFKDVNDIDNYLQKNVRGFIGGEEASESINHKIANSFTTEPDLFWYKHNGIIIFADSIKIKDSEVILQNPQIVNGGQTITTICKEWYKNNKPNQNAYVIVRLYKQSYVDPKTPKKTIEIISALNSQNYINTSDLKSNDLVQVMIERKLQECDHEYIRKRKKFAKSGDYKIKMVDLAKVFYCCSSGRPDISARGNVELLFENQSYYDSIFNMKAIQKELSLDHIIVKYITSWHIYNVKKEFGAKSKAEREYFRWTQYYVLFDVYQKMQKWIEENPQISLDDWLDFIQSKYFSNAIGSYAKPLIRIFTNMLPKNEEPSKYFRSKKAVEDFMEQSKSQKFDRFLSKEFDHYTKSVSN